MKLLFLLLSLVYYLFASFGHDFVTRLYVKVFHLFGRQVMELGLIVLFLIGLATVSFVSYCRYKKEKSKINYKGIALAVIALVFCHQFLIVTNVELVHFLQYMILGFLLCLFVIDQKVVLYLTLFLGMIDEFFQYVMYPSFTKYLDFNDFILDLVGGFLGILLFGFFSTNKLYFKRQIKIEWIYWFIFYCGMIFIILSQLNLIILKLSVPEIKSAFVELEGKSVFVLSYFTSSHYWETTAYNKTYHVLSILDGTILIILFCIAFQYAINEKEELEVNLFSKYPKFKFLEMPYPSEIGKQKKDVNSY